jgi:4,4'-diaponeurosporenoate glycosyltransferase
MITAAVFALGLALGGWSMSRANRLPAAGRWRDARLSVIIPARDEAANLPGLLGSLHDCGPAVSEVIVVDDDSTDATAAIAAAHGATVISVEGGPPTGWAGKPYACARGAQAASAPLLLFLDADVTLAPHTVDRLVATHAVSGGLVSVQPWHRTVRPYEQLSAVCNVVAMMGTGAFAGWRRRPRPAAFGPCMLTSAADYALAGGHGSVRGEVVDDVQLARRYGQAGLDVGVYGGDDALSFRMYPQGPRQLVEGWSKNLAAGAGLVDPAAVAVSVLWIASCLGFGLGGIATAVAVAVDPGSVSAADAAVALGGWLAVAIEMRWLLRRAGDFRWYTWALHLLPVAAFVGLFARSAWLTHVRRQVRWRGRPISIGGEAG